MMKSSPQVPWRRYRVLLLTVLMLTAGACSRETTTATAPNVPILAATTELATFSAEEVPYKCADGAASHATGKKQEGAVDFAVTVNAAGRGYAYVAKAGEGVYVVHNGKRGAPYQDVDHTTLRVSPDGQRVVYGAKKAADWVLVVDGKEFGPFVSIGPPVFSPDSRSLVCEVQQGDRWRLYLNGKLSELVPSYYDKPYFNATSQRVMYVENTSQDQLKRMVIADLELKPLYSLFCAAQPLAVSEDKTRIAAVSNRGSKFVVVDLSFARPSNLREGTPYDGIKSVALSPDGKSLAYIAFRMANPLAVLNGREEPIPRSDQMPWPPVIKPGKGVGIQIFDKDTAYLHEAFVPGAQPNRRYTEVAELVYSADGAKYAHIAIANNKFLTVVNGVDGPLYDRVIGPRFSPDGRYVAYRARQDGKRFMVVTDAAGKVLSTHRAYDQVFDPVFTADGKSVAYGVVDGRKIIWKVEPL